MSQISVIYLDGTFAKVSNDVLDVLIATGRISKFKREEGWVDLDKDRGRLRDYLRPAKYEGADRRAPWPSKK